MSVGQQVQERPGFAALQQSTAMPPVRLLWRALSLILAWTSSAELHGLQSAMQWGPPLP
jgi:hypothetical protein